MLRTNSEKQNTSGRLQEIDAETMELLLHYVYTGQVQDFLQGVCGGPSRQQTDTDSRTKARVRGGAHRTMVSNAADILSLAHKYNAPAAQIFPGHDLETLKR